MSRGQIAQRYEGRALVAVRRSRSCTAKRRDCGKATRIILEPGEDRSHILGGLGPAEHGEQFRRDGSRPPDQFQGDRHGKKSLPGEVTLFQPQDEPSRLESVQFESCGRKAEETLLIGLDLSDLCRSKRASQTCLHLAVAKRFQDAADDRVSFQLRMQYADIGSGLRLLVVIWCQASGRGSDR